MTHTYCMTSNCALAKDCVRHVDEGMKRKLLIELAALEVFEAPLY